MNLGEIFISLGFDVNEEKLNAFSSKINGLQKDMLSLSAVAAGAVLGLGAFMRGSIDSATALENLHDATGENIIAMEKWMSAGHLANTALGYDAIRGSIEGVNKAMSDISMGGGDTKSLGRLHLSWQNADGTIKKGTQILDEVRKNWARDEEFFKQWGGTPAHLKALEGIGINAGLQQALMQNNAQWNKGAANYIDVEATIERNKKLGQDIENLTGKFQKLKDTLVGNWAEPLGKILDQVAPEFKRISDGFDMINGVVLKTALAVAAGLAVMFSPLFAAGAAAAVVVGLLRDLGEIKRVGLAGFGAEIKEGVENILLDSRKIFHWNKQGAMPDGSTMEEFMLRRHYATQGSRDSNGDWQPPGVSTITQNNNVVIHGANNPPALVDAITEAQKGFGQTLKQLNNGGQ